MQGAQVVADTIPNSVSQKASLSFLFQQRGRNAIEIIASEREVVLFAVDSANSATVFQFVVRRDACACGLSYLVLVLLVFTGPAIR